MCHNATMNVIPVVVGRKGRVVVPAAFRHRLGIDEGSELVARIEGETIVLEPRLAAVRRLQSLVGAAVPAEVSLVDELLAERRAEARRDAGD
jgi:AbrB family looped-hinge helix DNA binding protein